MGDPCRIRPATLADVPALAALEPRCFSDPWSAQGFEEMLAAPYILGIIAERRNGELTGYLVARVVRDEGEILNIAVAPERRGKGVGGRLLDSGLNALLGRGAIQVFLEVRASNQPALKLYASRGFRAVGQRAGYYRRPLEDAIVLRWEGLRAN